MGWGGDTGHAQLNSAHTHANTQIRERKMAAHWSQKFSAIWGYAEFYLSFLWGRYILTLSRHGFHFIELPSFLWVRALKGGKIPAVTLFQSSSLYERVLPKAGPEHTVSTEKREKEKKRQSNKPTQHNRSTPQSLCKDRHHFTVTNATTN